MGKIMTAIAGVGLMLGILTSELRAQFDVRPPELLGRLESEVPYVRGAALLELAERGPGDAWATRQIARMLVDPDPEVREAAVIAFHDSSPDPQYALPVLVEMLGDSNSAAAAQAARVLASFDARAVPYLSAALQDPRAGYWAAQLLQARGPQARGAVPALLNVLASDEQVDPATRREVIRALGAIGPAARVALPALLEELNGDDRAAALAATSALGAMGRGANLAAPALREQLLQTSDAELRTVTAWALAGVDPDDPSAQNLALSTLVDELTHPQDERARQTAAEALVRLQPNRDPWHPQLADALARSSPAETQRALQALADVGRPAAPGLAAMLRDPRSQEVAARVLQRLGPTAAEAVPALTAALPRAQPPAQREMLFALAAIGPASAPAVPEIAPLTEEPAPQVRYPAIYALGTIGSPAAEAAPQLRRALASPDSFTRFSSAAALVRIESPSPALADEVLPPLIAALQHDRPFVRAEAAATLGALGRLAEPAAAALRTAAHDDPDEQVRVAARAALAQIRD